MQRTIKHIIFGCLILLVLPIGVLASGWVWLPNGHSNVLHVFFLITESAGSPWGVITCCLFALWFLLCLHPSLNNAIKLVFLLVIMILAGQGIKSVVKNSFEEPRPFVAWMGQQHQLDNKSFYALPRQQRATLIAQQLRNSKEVPGWLYQYWERETGYSFPSGHALFAASWALLAVGLLWQKRCYVSVTLLMLWQMTIATSRLVLGMHWPVDLILSTIIAGFIAVLTSYIAKRWQIMDIS